MVLSTLYQEWTHRLAALEEEQSFQPADQRWLSGLRIKILRFMLARYAETVTTWPEESMGSTPPTVPGRPRPGRRRQTAPAILSLDQAPIEHLPRRGETMAPTLDAIANANRIANPAPDLEQIWNWWSQRWLGRDS